MKKRGMELSINFLVIMIISIVVFGGGLYVINKFFGIAQEEKARIDRQTEERILSLLDDGSRVAIPINRKAIKRGDSHVFGLGVLNVLKKDSKFDVRIRFNKAFGVDNELIQGANAGNYIDRTWIFSDSQITTIESFDKEIIPLLVTVHGSMASIGERTQSTVPGTYIFDVCVCEEDCAGCPSPSNYYDGHIHKVYVEVN